MQEERARNHNIRKLWAPRFWLSSRLHFGQQRLLQRFSVLALHLLSTHPPSEASHGESENSHHRLTRRELETMISANFGHRVLAFAFATFSEQRLRQRFGVHALLSIRILSTRKTNIASHASASDTHPLNTKNQHCIACICFRYPSFLHKVLLQ